MHQVLHREVQYLRQKFITILVIVAVLVPLVYMIIAFILQIGFDIEISNNSMTGTSLFKSVILAVVFAGCMILLFRYTNLMIEIRTDGFHYKYFPFHKKVHRIAPEDVISWEIKIFRPIADYGGWGIRFGFGNMGKGYIAGGNKGVQFLFANNKKVLFSLNEPEKAKIALEKIFK